MEALPVPLAIAKERLGEKGWISIMNYHDYAFIYDSFYGKNLGKEIFSSGDEAIVSSLKENLGPSDDIVRNAATKFYQAKTYFYNNLINSTMQELAAERWKPAKERNEHRIKDIEEFLEEKKTEKAQFQKKMIKKYGI